MTGILVLIFFLLFVLWLVYFMSCGVLGNRRKKLIKLVSVKNPAIKTGLENLVGHYPNQQNEEARIDSLIEAEVVKMSNDEVSSIYAKYISIRRNIKRIELMLIMGLVVFFSLLLWHLYYA